MRKFSELLGRTPSSSASVRLTDFGVQYGDANGHHANGHSGNGHDVNGHESGGHDVNGHDANGFSFELDDPSDISARLGEDNEALRNLLVETGRKISELEEFRASFASVVEPANKALRALEHEKTQNIGLRRALTQTRAGYEALHTRCADIEAKAAAAESANKQLRQDLEKALDATREVKSGKAELANELAVARATIADLERRLTQQAAVGLGLSEDNRRLRDQAVEAETKIGHLDGELTAAREKLVFLEGDNRSSQKSLDQAVAEAARLSQRLSESETALVTAKARLLKVETALAEVEAAHDRLTVDLKDTSERYHADNTKLDRQVEALQARASAADKLLVSTRQLLVTRSEEARSSERKAREALFARDTAEKKLSEIKAAIKLKESQVEELEKTRSTLHERSTMLAHSLRSCKVQLTRRRTRSAPRTSGRKTSPRNSTSVARRSSGGPKSSRPCSTRSAWNGRWSKVRWRPPAGTAPSFRTSCRSCASRCGAASRPKKLRSRHLRRAKRCSTAVPTPPSRPTSVPSSRIPHATKT